MKKPLFFSILIHSIIGVVIFSTLKIKKYDWVFLTLFNKGKGGTQTPTRSVSPASPRFQRKANEGPVEGKVAVGPAKAGAGSLSANGNSPEPVEGTDPGGKVIARIEPKYPRFSRILGEEGEVFVQVRISEKGEVTAVTLEKSSGFPRLDRAALEAAKLGKFQLRVEISEPISKKLKVVFKIRDAVQSK